MTDTVGRPARKARARREPRWRGRNDRRGPAGTRRRPRLRAAEVILAIRARGFAVSRKADRSVVTEADQAAEALIVAGLLAAAPEIPVVAEEAVAAGAVIAASPVFWLVDPLDGTREFTDGNDDFAVNIGLVRDGRIRLGVVGVPATGELFGGIVGVGAWKRLGGVETPVHARAVPVEGLTVLASRHHGDTARMEAFLAGRVVAKTMNFGSSLKFCRLAEGIADLVSAVRPNDGVGYRRTSGSAGGGGRDGVHAGWERRCGTASRVGKTRTSCAQVYLCDAGPILGGCFTGRSDAKRRMLRTTWTSPTGPSINGQIAKGAFARFAAEVQEASLLVGR